MVTACGHVDGAMGMAMGSCMGEECASLRYAAIRCVCACAVAALVPFRLFWAAWAGPEGPLLGPYTRDSLLLSRAWLPGPCPLSHAQGTLEGKVPDGHFSLFSKHTFTQSVRRCPNACGPAHRDIYPKLPDARQQLVLLLRSEEEAKTRTPRMPFAWLGPQASTCTHTIAGGSSRLGGAGVEWWCRKGGALRPQLTGARMGRSFPEVAFRSWLCSRGAEEVPPLYAPSALNSATRWQKG